MKNLKVALAVTAALVTASGVNAFENEKDRAEKVFFSGLAGKTVMEAGESSVPMVEVSPGITEEFDGEVSYLTEYDRIEALFEEGTAPEPEDIAGIRPAVMFSSDSPSKKTEVTVYGIDLNKFTSGAGISLLPRPVPQSIEKLFTPEEFRSESTLGTARNVYQVRRYESEVILRWTVSTGTAQEVMYVSYPVQDSEDDFGEE